MTPPPGRPAAEAIQPYRRRPRSRFLLGALAGALLLAAGTVAEAGLIISDESRRWPGGVIPYAFDDNLPSQAVTDILDAMEEWEVNTVISFRARVSGDANWVQFGQLVGNFSTSIGMAGGAQQVFIDVGAGSTRSLALHEIGHAIGLFHEHSRPDRDLYIIVNAACDPWFAGTGNYNIVDETMVGPYDFTSVMHYDTVETFGCRDLVRRSPSGDLTEGGFRLSFGDVTTVNTAYLGVMGDALASPSAGYAVASGDFDGDGHDDVAIGVPGASVSGIARAGKVEVYDGSSSLTTITQNDVGGTSPEPGDGFGAALAAGYFNDDGYADLAIGSPSEDWGSDVDAGVVHVVYGSSSGLRSTGNQHFHQDLSALTGTSAEDGDAFGRALASGDLDGDGRDDLAIGAPNEDWGSTRDAGSVHVVYSDGVSLLASGSTLMRQGTSGMQSGNTEPDDAFGWALAIGDFDCDGYEDLAVGSPGEAVGADAFAGAVFVLPGSAEGVTTSGSRIFHQDVDGLGGLAEPGDLFGYALAAGNFDASLWSENPIFFNCRDLAVGIPGEDQGSTSDAGHVQVLYGVEGGLPNGGNEVWRQADSTLGGERTETSDWFGGALVAADFDGDYYTDLAIGVPGENGSGFLVRDDMGLVNVLEGTFSGLESISYREISQSPGLVTSSATRFERFGWALAAGDFDGDGAQDLVVGVPRDRSEVNYDFRPGSAHLFFGDLEDPGDGDYWLYGLLWPTQWLPILTSPLVP